VILLGFSRDLWLSTSAGRSGTFERGQAGVDELGRAAGIGGHCDVADEDSLVSACEPAQVCGSLPRAEPARVFRDA
jgi:hypothetical protein